MRKIEVEYRCDRCGEEFRTDGQNKKIAAKLLNDDGWRGMAVSYYLGSDTDIFPHKAISRDLCRTCYTGLVAYIEMSDREMDKVASGTVE